MSDHSIPATANKPHESLVVGSILCPWMVKIASLFLPNLEERYGSFPKNAAQFFSCLWRVSKCQYVPTEMLIYMEMLFDIESLVTVTAQRSFQRTGYYCSGMWRGNRRGNFSCSSRPLFVVSVGSLRLQRRAFTLIGQPAELSHHLFPLDRQVRAQSTLLSCLVSVVCLEK